MYKTPEERASIAAARALHCAYHPTRSVTLKAQTLGRAKRRTTRQDRPLMTFLTAFAIIGLFGFIGALWMHVGGQ